MTASEFGELIADGVLAQLQTLQRMAHRGEVPPCARTCEFWEAVVGWPAAAEDVIHSVSEDISRETFLAAVYRQILNLVVTDALDVAVDVGLVEAFEDIDENGRAQRRYRRATRD